MQPKEPVIRLNKDIREEILGNVIAGRFRDSAKKREVALAGFELLKEINSEFREQVAPLLLTSPQRFHFSKDCFDICMPRKKGTVRRSHIVYLNDFMDVTEHDSLEGLEWQKRSRLSEQIFGVIFEGDPEMGTDNNKDPIFRGFVSASNYVYLKSMAQGKAFFKLVDELNEIQKNKETLRAQTAAVLSSCYTMKQLLEVWPNVVNYAPTLIPSPTAGVALVVRVEDIDALIVKGT